ncbi:MAG: hypothetical protein ABFD64_00960 [Armatimonadota bacterium]
MMKSAVCTLFALLVLSGAAFAADTAPADKASADKAPANTNKISIALSAGAFFPLNSSTKDEYNNCWTRVSLKTFEAEKPREWRFIAEGGAFNLSGESNVKLYPLTFGVEKGLTESRNIQPYLTFRAGPYYGKVTEDATGLDEDHIGLNANASFGATVKKKFYVEVRYDYFSRFAGTDFDGISLSAGMRLFDIKL